MTLPAMPPTESTAALAGAVDLDALRHAAASLMAHGRFEQAIACLEQVCAHGGGTAAEYNDLGLAHRCLWQMEASRRCFEQADALRPDLVGAKFNLSKNLLVEGDFDGFALYEHRLRHDTTNTPPGLRWNGGVKVPDSLQAVPRWSGGDLQGKHILIWCEQGLGDNLMMLRYLPLLRARGAARISALCSPKLAATMATLADHVLADPDAALPPGIDCYCPSMSLPLGFGTRLDTIPQQLPYLHVPAERQRAWAGSLASVPGLKVGLAWAGDKAMPRDAWRSMALRQLEPLMGVDGVTWISLQRGEAADELGELGWRVLDWAYHCEDLLDTAALIEQLDLVVTVDTAVAHLAGALGKPVWLMSRYEGEWRWLRGRQDSPWYPSMQIFSQQAAGDWGSVVGAVAQAIQPLAAGSAAPQPMTNEQWSACVRDCARGPQSTAPKGFFARWFG
jgi:tetratricopeptide (TPR) repeat protein